MEATSTSLGAYRQIVREYFGVEGAATRLPGYSDTNMRIDGSDGDIYVLRVSHSDTNLEVLAFVEHVMSTAQSASFETPRAVPTVTGDPWAELPNGEIARLHTWVDGATYAETHDRVFAARSIGRTAGEMVNILSSIETTVVFTDSRWDLRHAAATIESHLHHISGTGRRDMIEVVLHRLMNVPMGELPQQVIHNDLNDRNLLLERDHVSGVIDFGVTRKTIRIAELAIACAYAMLDQEEPLSIAGEVCSGYRDFASITGTESAQLFTLIMGRLATSVCIAASRPFDNTHQHESESEAWNLLARLTAADMDTISIELSRAAL